MSRKQRGVLALGAFAVALALLPLNDWLFKRTPSVLTGKLSDAA